MCRPPRRPGSAPELTGGGRRGSGGCRCCPRLIFMIVVTQLPFVATLVISFMRWNALGADAHGFTGFRNYQEVVHRLLALRGSVIDHRHHHGPAWCWSAWPSGWASRCCWTEKFHGRAIVRTIMIAPFLIVPVAAALLFKQGHLQPRTTACSTAPSPGSRTCSAATTRPSRTGSQTQPRDRGRGGPDLAVDAVHDADPAGRAAVTRSRGLWRRPGWTACRRWQIVPLSSPYPHVRRVPRARRAVRGACSFCRTSTSCSPSPRAGWAPRTCRTPIYQTFSQRP